MSYVFMFGLPAPKNERVGEYIEKTIKNIREKDLKGLTELRAHSFSDCKELKTVVIPEGVTSIGDGAFYQCYQLVDVSIPESIKLIGNDAFKGCSCLSQIIISGDAITIEDFAFCYCIRLRYISLQNVVGDLPSVFYGCTGLETALIGDGPTTLRATFVGCSKLKTVRVPNTLTKLGSNLFVECETLDSINIPESVTQISNAVFQGCISLTNVVIPKNVGRIDAYALTIGSTTNKATITFLSTTPPSIHLYTFNADYLNKIIVPAGCGEAYKAATNWSAFADYIEEAAA